MTIVNNKSLFLKKFLMLLFVLTLVSACASKKGADGEYDVVDSQTQANKMNKDGDSVEVTVPDKVYFAFDKYNISDDSAEILDLQAQWLQDNKKIKILVAGHCDERGTREYNMALGMRRANAVKQYLVKKGVAAKRIEVISYGKERPLFLGTGEAIWAKNRVAVTSEVK